MSVFVDTSAFLAVLDADDSPALRLGFEPIPITKIGIRRDAYRSALPPTQ